MVSIQCLLVSLLLTGAGSFRINSEGGDTQASFEPDLDDDEAELESSPYDFGDAWSNLSFNEMWEQFYNAVPLSDLQDHWDPDFDLGPACWPSLDGSPNSNKLAVLVHGYTSCPTTLSPLARQLVEEGYRVLRPVLPGHGRKWQTGDTAIRRVGDDGTEEEESNVKYRDDLSTMPEEPGPYLVFAEALGKMVEQFKAEHPDGLVVVQGHSLGGIVAAKFAMERPKIVDRLLLMNPMFGLHTRALNPIVNMGAGARVSWSLLGNRDCETMRGKNSGGYCQFKLKNIVAMVNTAYLILCEQWGIEEACRYYSAEMAAYAAGVAATTTATKFTVIGAAIGTPFGPPGMIIGGAVAALTGLMVGAAAGTQISKALGRWAVNDSSISASIRQGFADIKQIQAVQTAGDPAVDNKMIEKLMDEVGKHQTMDAQMSYCQWPTALTHCYNNDRDEPSVEGWFHPYTETALGNFLATGKFVDIVRRSSLPYSSKNVRPFGACIQNQYQVAWKYLTVLPSVQQKEYILGGVGDAKGYPHPLTARAVFTGMSLRQSEGWSSWSLYKWRQIELLDVPMGTLLVTREKKDDTVKAVYLLAAGRSNRTDGSYNCVQVGMHKLSNVAKAENNLYEQLHAPSHSGTVKLKFCKSINVVEAICERQGCD